MNRIDRITAILIQLQSRRVVKAQHIADRFSISLRTVYRDIRSLEESGVPILGEPGVGYSLMEGYRLPPVMFTREEAIAFLTAEKLVQKFTDQANNQSFQSAMFKIKAVLRTAEKDYLERIDESIAVLKGRPWQQQTPVNPLQDVLKAIADKRVVMLNYFSHYRQEKTQRAVEPVGIFHAERHWHLIGFCRMRKGYRDFRFDRIADYSVSPEQFCTEHLSLKQYLEQDRSYKERPLHPVTIFVEKAAIPYICDEKYYHGFVSQTEKEGGAELYFLSSSLCGFAKWYLLFGEYAQIVSPESLKTEVCSVAGKVIERFSGD